MLLHFWIAELNLQINIYAKKKAYETHNIESQEIDHIKHTLFDQMKAPKNNAIKMDDHISGCSCTVLLVHKKSGKDRQYKERK